MHWLDWTVLGATLLFISAYGMYVSRKNVYSVDEFLKGREHIKWWTIGLSVMATQASAITFMSTPGQAFHDGMGFVQFYFGLPIAMVIICATFIPIFHNQKILTAYEYLENRFDNRTRMFTAILFLIQRGLGAGITIYAPSIILSTILGWNLTLLNVLTGSMVILYTVSGGTKAVSITQKQQMFVIFAGMVASFVIALNMLPDQIHFGNALEIAGLSGKMDIVDFSFNVESRYTFWSGITGGMFLALAYFGTDQSQVQRYISGNNVKESRLGLVFNGLLKIPMQFFILLCGIMVYVFFLFQPAPVFFNTPALEKAKEGKEGIAIKNLETRYDSIFQVRKALLLSPEVMEDHKAEVTQLNNTEREIRANVKSHIKASNPDAEDNDKDYVFIYFILSYLPKGIVGLLLAVIFCAAMSSSSSELSALATCTTIDIYKRNFAKDASDLHYVRLSRWFTIMWGVIAIGFANISSLFENLIQFVNIVGSVFYGTILGIFLSGFYLPHIKARHIFPAAVITECMVIVIFSLDIMGYLWLNAVGCVSVVFLALLFTKIFKAPAQVSL
ncbi:MAG: sodium:solute symporter [Saprospiraceae bacterium]|nr:sodium:solute symporter [Saprospiraceae bacterium]